VAEDRPPETTAMVAAVEAGAAAVRNQKILFGAAAVKTPAEVMATATAAAVGVVIVVAVAVAVVEVMEVEGVAVAPAEALR